MQTRTADWKFPGAEPRRVNKKAFLDFLKTSLANGEVSWLITDTKSFEWPEISMNRGAFLRRMDSMKFKEAYVGVYYPQTKQISYSSFMLVSH